MNAKAKKKGRQILTALVALALCIGMIPMNTQTAHAAGIQGGTADLTVASSTSGTITREPTNGTAEIKDGKLVYTPNAGFSGTDTVTLTETKDITLSAAIKDDTPQATLSFSNVFGEDLEIKANETVTGTLTATWSADGAAENNAITVNGVSGTVDGENITFSTDYGTFSISFAEYSAKKESLTVSFAAINDLESMIDTLELAVTCTDGDGSTATAKKSFDVDGPDSGPSRQSLPAQSTTPDFTVYEAGLTASTGQSAGSHAGEDAYPTTATYTLSSEYTSDGWQIASVEAKGSKGYGIAAKTSDTEVAYTLSGAQTHTNGEDLTEDVTVTLTKTVTVNFEVVANDEPSPATSAKAEVKKTKATKSAKTGDDTPLILCGALIAATAVCASTSVICRRRKS